MAKRDWSNGDHMTPDFLDLYWGTNASNGHNHQGLDADGSCPKISITDSVDDYLTGTINVDVTSTYFTTPVNVNWTYTKIGNVVHITTEELRGYHATNTELVVTPNTTWPTLILPTLPKGVPVALSKQDAGTAEERMGVLWIQTGAADTWQARITDSSGELSAFNFGVGGSAIRAKVFFRQTITYIVD
ncbi:MAG: hypothetical protein KAI70_00605 [Candidatus Omnitrophica bacterium]|nr:hypothetical protein [Candidatus Omnitrophota bacterium]